MTTSPTPDTAAVERVARHLAAKDWATTPDGWDGATASFRAEYLALAREVIALAAPAALPVSVVSGQTLRDRVAEAREQLRAMALGLATGTGPLVEPRAFDAALDAYRAAVLAVLPPDGHTTNRADVLREAADRFDQHAEQILDGVGDKAVFVAKALRDQAAVWREAAETLRRLAAEARGPWTADDRLKPHAIPAATTPDVPSMTGGFDDSIEIPELAAEAPQPEPDAACAHCGSSDHSWDGCEAYTKLVTAESPVEETGAELARHIADRPVSEIQAAFRILGWPPLRFELVEAQPAQHAPGRAILCPDCSAKGHAVCQPAAVVPAAGAGQDETQEGDRG